MELARNLALFASIAITACAPNVLFHPAGETSSSSPDGSGGSGGAGGQAEGGGGAATVTTGTTGTTTSEPPPDCDADLSENPHHCGGCGHDCLGGDCQSGKCQPIVLLEQGGQPWEIALDADHVYWSNTHGEITKIPKGGGAPFVLTHDLVNPGALAYFDGRLYSASYGGPVSVISTAGGPLQSLTATGSGGVGVAVDASSVYWANGNLWPSTETLVRTDHEGNATTAISSQEHMPTSIAVDVSHVYWSDFTDPSEPGGVRRAPIGGGATETLVTGPYLIQLALDATHVYYIFGGDGEHAWANGALYAIPKAGGAPTLLAVNLDGASRLAVDASHVYWTESYGMMIRRVPKEGGAVETLATSNGNPQGIAVDDLAVYWVDPGNQRIMKLAK